MNTKIICQTHLGIMIPNQLTDLICMRLLLDNWLMCSRDNSLDPVSGKTTHSQIEFLKLNLQNSIRQLHVQS